MFSLDKRFPSTNEDYPGQYSVILTQIEELTNLSASPNDLLKFSVIFKRQIKQQNWTELSKFIPTLLSTFQLASPHLHYLSLQSLSELCITYSLYINYHQLFIQLQPSIKPLMHSEFKQLRLEVFKFLSIVFQRNFSAEFLQFFDDFESYLEMHVDEEAMAYILEILLGMFERLSEQQVERVVKQASGVLEKAVEKDLVDYCFGVIKEGIKDQKFIESAVKAGLGKALIVQIGNVQCFDKAFEAFQQVAGCPEMGVVFRDSLGCLVQLLSHSRPDVRHFAAEQLAVQSSLGWEYLENMINRNFIPVLVNYLTSDEQVVKKNMIEIAKNFFRQQLQHQIIELLENNVVSVLCRIIERDANNNSQAFEAMEYLLDGGNEIFKSFADSCRFSRLLNSATGNQEVFDRVQRIITKHYPRVPMPKKENFIPNSHFGYQAAVINSPIGGNSNQTPSAINLMMNSSKIQPLSSYLAQTNNAPLTLFNNQPGALFSQSPAPINQAAPVINANLTGKPDKAVRNKKKVAVKSHKKVKADNKVKSVNNAPKKVLKQTKIPFQNAGKRQSASSKASLILPVSRIYKMFKQTRLRVSKKSAVFMTGVLEYITSEVLQLAKDLVIEAKRKIITPKDISNSIKSDEELYRFLPRIIIRESGNSSLFLPH